MSTRDRLRLAVEMLIATAILAFGSLAVRYAHGQTLNDRSEAACKANKQWLEKCWQQGVIARIPCGTIYLRDWAETPVTVGCGRIETNGAGGYWIPADHPTLAGKTSRLCQLTPGKGIFRLRGGGLVINGPVYLEGNGDAAAIEVEGRSVGVATGHHRIHDVCFHNFRQCCKALAGYYNSAGEFVKDENHADNCTLRGCIAIDCDTVFRSENQQALNWTFDGFFWQGTTRGGQAVAFDIDRGGSLTVNRFIVENAKCKILRLGDYSDNQCKFDIDVWFDSMLDPNPEFTLVELTKPDLFWAQWFINMRGWIGKQPRPIPQCVKYNVPANMNKSGWKIDLDYVGKAQPK